MYLSSIRDYRFQYWDHVSDGSVRCVIGTRNCEMTEKFSVKSLMRLKCKAYWNGEVSHDSKWFIVYM